MELQADFQELEPSELVAHLLSASGQSGTEPTNAPAILDFLKLQFVAVDLSSLIGNSKKQPRGVLSYSDRIVGVDRSLTNDPKRARFTTLHEVGHYVLPTHQNDLYLCDDQDLGFEAMIEVERQANAFAAELMFKGDQFTREANDCAISPECIKTLALRYDASFEASSRRFVERNAHACSLAVFARLPGLNVIGSRQAGRWQHKYSVTSPEFRSRYFRNLTGEVPIDVVRELVVPGRDFAESIDREVTISTMSGEAHLVQVSFFTNHHCIFGLVQPAKSGGR